MTLIAVAILFLSQTSTQGLPLLPQHRSQETGASPSISLEAVLARAAEYCRKLESSSFDFVCREEISETIDPNLDIDRNPPPQDSGRARYSGPTITISKARKIKHRFVYDYQCVRTGQILRETRTLLEENKKKKVVPNAELKTQVVDFGKALLSPVGFFGERSQPDYDFSVTAEEEIGQIRAVVVEAKPKPGALLARNLYGKAWINPLTGDVLRIEWSENRAGRFDVFEKRAELYQRQLRLIIRSELGAEMNGIRFPSRLSVEEAYLNEAGKPFVRSKTEVTYNKFAFKSVTHN